MNKYGIYKNGIPVSQKDVQLTLKDMNITDEDLSALISWLSEGGCFYDNPNHLIGENGQEMSFIEAYRDMKH